MSSVYTGLGWNARLYPNLTSSQPIIARAEQLIPQWEQKNSVYEIQRKDQRDLSDIKISSETEIRNLNNSHIKLSEFYQTLKRRSLLMIKDQINNTINTWYNNDYNFRFFQKTSRGKVHTNLKDLKRGGNLEHVCGGAVKQTVSVLFDIIFIRNSGGVFIFFDEAFNSLGMDEIKDLPDVLTSIQDLQIVLIEHKCTIIPEEFAVIINVKRELGGSSRVIIEDPSGFLKTVYELFAEQNTTTQDIQILRDYGFTAEQITDLVAVNAEKLQSKTN